MIGALNANEQRQKELGEVIPYFKVTASILIKKENLKDYQKLKDEINPQKIQEISDKKKIITFPSSLYVQKLKEYFENNPKFQVDENNFRDNLPAVLDLIKKGNTDAFVNDTPVIQNIVNNFPNDFASVELNNNVFGDLKPFGLFVNSSYPNKAKIKEALLKVLDLNTKPLKSEDEIDAISDAYKDIFLNKAIKNYQQIQQKLKNQKPFPGFIKLTKKIWSTLPTYKKGFITSFIISIDSVILGFLLALIFVKTKTLIKHYQKTNQKNLMRVYRTFSFFINKTISFLNAIPLTIQALLVFNLFNLFQILRNNTMNFYAALFVLVLNTAANLVKIMMHNIKILSQGQIEAGYALGMSHKQVFHYIIFEQGIKRSYPSVGQQFINNIKNTSLFQIIGLSSLLLQAQRNTTLDFDLWTPYIIVCAIYLIIVFITNFILDKIKKTKQN
ncbi:putative amino-acid ABC transporter permease protein yqiY [Strawberry lethal yellows phytoplasma (CPA) str. NZSb11]|uniref:Putative amino-acid ABC transporter permease protein yqiY n=1 Tax=Strawberry lethal yellows phytoplasma (CPA) str. NZSb11 TaxID=980422 RepID=R4RZV3_PHYAS|nr:putative amino-acid ABC transporter permease protein yqiY [Strawberry lethal yellows phytoplasma (CPA) str. NZSb11]